MQEEGNKDQEKEEKGKEALKGNNEDDGPKIMRADG